MKMLKTITLLFAIGCVIFTGCATRSYTKNEALIRQKQAAENSSKIASNYGRQGIMTSDDYLRWEQVGNKTSLKKRIDDDDLDWAISLMHKPSTEPSDMHKLVMGLFLTARVFTPLQQQKIRAAVTPLLSSSDGNESKWAKAVLKKIG